MARLLTVISRLKSVDIDDIAQKSLFNTQDTAIELNQEQMTKGLNADGTYIGVLSPKYAAQKKKRGGQAPAGISDQYNSGDEYEGMNMAIYRDTFVIQSSVDYFKDNEERYGKQVFKLSKESKKKYVAGEFGKEFRKFIAKKTKLL